MMGKESVNGERTGGGWWLEGGRDLVAKGDIEGNWEEDGLKGSEEVEHNERRGCLALWGRGV